jgi:hypothetical protein
MKGTEEEDSENCAARLEMKTANSFFETTPPTQLAAARPRVPN